MALAIEPSVRDLSPREGFGALLKAWREARGLSQSALAAAANVSQRHLSYLEQGRSHPTRSMIVTLARALGVPLRDRNTLFFAAGFAPSYAMEALSSDAMAPIEAALSHALSAHEPLPALVIDMHWNALRTNQGAARLFQHYLGHGFLEAASAGAPLNLIEALCADDGLKRSIVNWPAVARSTAERLRHEALGGIADGRTRALIQRLEMALGAPHKAGAEPQPALPFVDLVLSDGKETTRWFTAVMAFGSPADVTLQETRIEFFYPVDAATAEFARRLAVTT